MTDFISVLTLERLLPVITAVRPAAAAAVADALEEAGLPLAEVTLRTPDALDSLREMSGRPRFMVGAGTVLRPHQVEDSVGAGARFVVSPGFSAAVADECRATGVPYIPGVATATDVQRALEHDLTVLKFFPAETLGGPAAVEALSHPFPQVRFMASGGVDLSHLAAYLRTRQVLAVGGGWLVSPGLPTGADLAGVVRAVTEARAVVRSIGEEQIVEGAPRR